VEQTIGILREPTAKTERFVMTSSTRGSEGVTHRKVMDTTFSMDVGETAVVGTSKLNGGDEALVVLLTVTD
jgi:hypothetical protein